MSERQVFPEETLIRLGNAVRAVERMPRDERPFRRRAPVDYYEPTVTNEGSGGGCECCNPSNCADYVQPISNSDCEDGPFAWEVNFGNDATIGDLCTLGGASSGRNTFHLEYIDYGIWQSENFTCPGSVTVGGCNDEGGDAECCTGSAEMHWDGAAWSETSNTCSDGCSGQTPSIDGNGDLSVPCTDGVNVATYNSTDGLAWDGLIESNCNTTPPHDAGTYAPAMAGAGGDIRSFPCCDSSPTLPEGDQYSYIQLTVNNARDSDNRSRTKLELIVGGVAAFTYVLPIGRDFCCTCEQKFELKCCGPWAFRFLPESICLRPMAPSDFDDKYVDVPGGWQCCTPFTVNGSSKLPKYLAVSISGSPGACDTGCCDALTGDWLLEWNDGFLQRWRFDNLGPKCFYDVICDDAATCASFYPNVSIVTLDIQCRLIGSDWLLVFEVAMVDYLSNTTPECGGGGAGACHIPGCTDSNFRVVGTMYFPITEGCFSGVMNFVDPYTPGSQLCTLAVSASAVT